MPDGQTRQRRRTAAQGVEEDSRRGESIFVGFVWFVVTLFSLVPAKGATRGRAVCIGVHQWFQVGRQLLSWTTAVMRRDIILLPVDPGHLHEQRLKPGEVRLL